MNGSQGSWTGSDDVAPGGSIVPQGVSDTQPARNDVFINGVAIAIILADGERLVILRTLTRFTSVSTPHELAFEWIRYGFPVEEEYEWYRRYLTHNEIEDDLELIESHIIGSRYIRFYNSGGIHYIETDLSGEYESYTPQDMEEFFTAFEPILPVGVRRRVLSFINGSNGSFTNTDDHEYWIVTTLVVCFFPVLWLSTIYYIYTVFSGLISLSIPELCTLLISLILKCTYSALTGVIFILIGTVGFFSLIFIYVFVTWMFFPKVHDRNTRPAVSWHDSHRRFIPTLNGNNGEATNADDLAALGDLERARREAQNHQHQRPGQARGARPPLPPPQNCCVCDSVCDNRPGHWRRAFFFSCRAHNTCLDCAFGMHVQAGPGNPLHCPLCRAITHLDTRIFQRLPIRAPVVHHEGDGRAPENIPDPVPIDGHLADNPEIPEEEPNPELLEENYGQRVLYYFFAPPTAMGMNMVFTQIAGLLWNRLILPFFLMIAAIPAFIAAGFVVPVLPPEPNVNYGGMTNINWFANTNPHDSTDATSFFGRLGYFRSRIGRVYLPALNGDIFNRRVSSIITDDLPRFILSDVARGHPNLPQAVKRDTAIAIYQEILLLNHDMSGFAVSTGRRMQDAQY